MLKIATLRALLLPLCGMALIGLAACGPGGSQQTQTSATDSTSAGETVLRRGNGAEPSSLDPHFVTGTHESAILTDLLMGLATPDARGEPIPGAAERWETSADGKTWTFHLRDHQWSDGKPVTAGDFVYSWRRILDPKTAAIYASLLYVFKNAQPINAGKMPPDRLGVRAIDDKTLELQLENPAPYLPELLTHSTTLPLPRHVVEAKGKDWTKAGNFVGNGPYSLAEWVPNDHIALVKNPHFYDAANVKIESVVFYPTSDTDAALKRYRAGEIDTLNAVPASQLAFVKANMADQYQVVPYLASGWYIINIAPKPLDDIRVREALNLTYDRDTIAYKFLPFGEPPSYSLVPPGTANYPGGVQLSFKSIPYPERVKRAQELMRQAGYGPERKLTLTFMTSDNNDAKRVAAAAQQMWQAAYIDAQILQQDSKSYAINLQTGNFDVAAYGWAADFNDARNFLYLLMSDNAMNYGRYKNAAFDALIVQSDQEQDPAKRGQLLKQAEIMALKDSPWIPTRFQVTTDLVQTSVKGWQANVSATNPTRWLSLEKSKAR